MNIEENRNKIMKLASGIKWLKKIKKSVFKNDYLKKECELNLRVILHNKFYANTSNRFFAFSNGNIYSFINISTLDIPFFVIAVPLRIYFIIITYYSV